MCYLPTKFLLAAVTVIQLAGQDFDWVLSYMKPFRVPRFYGIVGVQGAIGEVADVGAVKEGGIVCAQYRNGAGFIVVLSGGGEWWVQPDASLGGCIGAGWVQSEHRAPGIVAPLITGETLRTEYVLSTSRLAISVQATAKKRMFARYGWISVGVEGMLLFPTHMVQREQVLEPGWYRFNTSPPSQHVRISDGIAMNVSMLLSIIGGIGYDIPIRQGMYCSPSFVVGLPLTLLAGNYRLWRIGITIPLAFSLQ